MDTRRRLKPQDYTVAWLCALAENEQVAAIGMLDEMHEDLLQPPGDDNSYIYGSIKGHNVIVACLPLGQPGTISASILVGSLPNSFPNLRIHMFVGIGGGIPHDPPSANSEKDIHLGDIVIGVAEKPGVTGVVQYDFERDHGSGGKELLGSLDKPDRRLLTALGKLFSLDLSGKSNFNLHLARLQGSKMDFTRPTSHEDRLYRSSYEHVDAGPNSTGCDFCHGEGLILRSERLSPHPVVHQGQILSGNAVIKSTPRRDELSQRFPYARCIEMEAAGVMDQTHCLVIRGIADYADSHKNQHWQPYAAGTAAAFAREFLHVIQPQEVTDIDPVASSQTYTQKDPPNPAAFTPDEKACLQSLHFPEMHWRRNDVADPTPSTCTWLLEHPKYCEWLGQGHGMLWIKGKPGAGKSTVLKHALETAERENTQGIALASFFFHGRGVPMQKTRLGLFRSLLYQILQKSRDLLSELTSLYIYRCETVGNFTEKWDWDNRTLQSFFKQNVVNVARTHPIRIYIDALDECGEHLATELVEFFRFFAVPIAICFSCRHYPFVALEGGNEVCVEHKNKQDIENYINDKINTHIQRVDIAQVIRDELVYRSNGNFQWVVLVLPRILKMHKSRKSLLAIQTMIRNIPAELNELYTNLLKIVDEDEKAQSLRLFQWIAFAFRPLTLRELRHALAVSADTRHSSLRLCRNSELWVDSDEDMERRICDFSKGLAEVSAGRSFRIVQFVHQSVKDFLIDRGFQILDDSSAGTAVGRGHFWLSRSCVKYFLMKEIRDTFISTQNNFDELQRMKESFHMLRYSLGYLIEHLKYVDVANMPQDDLVELESEHTDRILLPPWFAVYQRLRIHSDQQQYIPSELNGGTLLHAASEYNLIGVVKAILARISRADHKDQDSQSPLFIAAKKSHTGVVKMLIDRDDVDVNLKYHDHTPLLIAVKMGHAGVVEILMSREDIDVSSKDNSGDTPLSVAAAEGHEDIAEMLMTRDDVDASSKNNNGNTPLYLAAEGGNEATVKMLKERNGVDINSKNHRGDTPLSIAVVRNQLNIVKMLLNWNGVDVNMANESGFTPFLRAVELEHTSIARLLLEHGVDLSSNSNQQTMALVKAASYGHFEIMKLLIQHNADIDSRNSEGRTPLSHAAIYGNLARGSLDIVKLLLQHNADVESKDIEARTPLSHAASVGYPSLNSLGTVKLLLQQNADIKSKDLEGRTPLSYAAYYGSPDTVKLLLQHNADIDSKDVEGRTPLSHAASYNSLDIVKLLLQYNADIDSKDIEGRTPLSYSASGYYYKVVDLLLQYNADINTRDSKGRTPLSYAASFGHIAVVELLLERTDNADQKDEDGRTPFSYAVSCGDIEVAEAFLKRSVVVTEEDRDLMKESKYLRDDFSHSEEEEGQEEQSEEESEEAGSELEQNSKATKRKRSQFDSERPRKRIRTRIGAYSD